MFTRSRTAGSADPQPTSTRRRCVVRRARNGLRTRMTHGLSRNGPSAVRPVPAMGLPMTEAGRHPKDGVLRRGFGAAAVLLDLRFADRPLFFGTISYGGVAHRRCGVPYFHRQVFRLLNCRTSSILFVVYRDYNPAVVSPAESRKRWIGKCPWLRVRAPGRGQNGMSLSSSYSGEIRSRISDCLHRSSFSASLRS